MRTTGPTARAALTRLEALNRAVNSPASRRGSLCRNHPAKPLIPRQRRKVLPSHLHRRVQVDGLAQVLQDFVYGTDWALAIQPQPSPECRACSSAGKARLNLMRSCWSPARLSQSRACVIDERLLVLCDMQALWPGILRSSGGVRIALQVTRRRRSTEAADRSEGDEIGRLLEVGREIGAFSTGLRMSE